MPAEDHREYHDRSNDSPEDAVSHHAVHALHTHVSLCLRWLRDFSLDRKFNGHAERNARNLNYMKRYRQRTCDSKPVAVGEPAMTGRPSR